MAITYIPFMLREQRIIKEIMIIPVIKNFRMDICVYFYTFARVSAY